MGRSSPTASASAPCWPSAWPVAPPVARGDRLRARASASCSSGCSWPDARRERDRRERPRRHGLVRGARARLRARHPPDGAAARRRGRRPSCSRRCRRRGRPARRAFLTLAGPLPHRRGRRRRCSCATRPPPDRPAARRATRRRRPATRASGASASAERAPRSSRRRRCSGSSCSSCTTSAGLRRRSPPRLLAALQLLGRGQAHRRGPPLRPRGRADRADPPHRGGATAPSSPRPPLLATPPGAAALPGADRAPPCRTMSWNGLAFTAAAEIVGPRAAGTAMSLQNTILAVGGALAPVGVRRVRRGDVAGRPRSPCSPSRRSSPCSSCAPLEGDEDERASPNANGVSPSYARWRCPDDRFNAAHRAARGPVRPRGRRRLRHDDRRARPRGRRAALSRRRHRGPRRHACRSSRSGACSSTARSRRAWPPAEPHPLAVRSGDPRVDVQAALAMLAPEWGLRPLIDITDEQARDDLARASVMALSLRRAVRARRRPAAGAAARDRHGALDPRALPDPLARRGRPATTCKAIDAYWISRRRARHERVDVHRARDRLDRRGRRRRALGRRRRAQRPAARRRAVARARRCSTRSSARATPTRGSRDALDRGERLMGFGHRVYRAEDPRARVLRRTAQRARLGPLRGRRGARARRPRRAAGAQARPRARHERRVLVGGPARPRRGPAGALHAACSPAPASAGLVGAHPRAEARGAADPADGAPTWARRRAPSRRTERLAVSTRRPRSARIAPCRRQSWSSALRMMSRSARWSSGVSAGSGGGASSRRSARRSRTSAPALGDDEHLHAPVVRGAPALDEAAILEAVDDPRDVRVVAVQRLGEIAHRHGPSGLETPSARTWGGESSNSEAMARNAPAGGVEQLVHQRPGLTGRRRPAARRARRRHRASHGTSMATSLKASTAWAAAGHERRPPCSGRLARFVC